MEFLFLTLKNTSLLAVAPRCLTHALTLVVLVDEDVVQHEVQQLVLQRAVGVEDEGLETLPAAGRQLVAEDHQQVAQEHERLRKNTSSQNCSPPSSLRVQRGSRGFRRPGAVTCSLTSVLTLDKHC